MLINLGGPDFCDHGVYIGNIMHCVVPNLHSDTQSLAHFHLQLHIYPELL